MDEKTEQSPKQEWAQATLQEGEIVHIHGIPFELVDPVAVRGHPNNFPLAGLEADSEESTSRE